MEFRPKHCPNPQCSAFTPGARFRWRRRGHYRRACDGRAVQRFQCRECSKGFSAQTFRVDYRLKLSHLHFDVFDLLVSKVTLRQSARVLGTTRHTVEHRQLLLGRHARDFQFQQIARAPKPLPSSVYLLDELETFETSKRLRPVTVPMLVERESGFVVDLHAGAMPARGNLKPRERLRKQQLDALCGVRRSESNAVVRACLATLAKHVHPTQSFVVITDSKCTYPLLIRETLPERAVHVRVPSKTRKSIHHPLFKLHVNQAMHRDGSARLVRRSWAHSKLRERLEIANWIWVAWRNWIRPRTNRRRGESAASAIDLARGRWRATELFRWRVFHAA